MSVNLQTTQEIIDQNLANFEAALNQNSPLNDKAFLRVLSTNEGAMFTSLFKYGAERVLQNLVLTATAEDLDGLGNEYGKPRNLAQSTVLTFTLPGTNGTLIPSSVRFVGDPNGVTYIPDSDQTITGGIATIVGTAEEAGVSGNLNVSDTLTMDTEIAGAETVATVISVDTTGTEEETDDNYRVRILDVIRSQGGGSNTADYRNWSQEVAGVARAYPYSGRPVADPTATPPNRTVFVEADTSIDPDGLAPSSLLTSVRESITTNPDTGVARQALGQTDDLLFVISIIRTPIFIEIRNLDVAAELESQLKSDISTALTAFFLVMKPFVDGLDPLFDRNDLITDLTVSAIVQDLLSASGASATGVGFGLSVGSFLASYRLDPGEKVKLGTITYV